LVPLSRTELLNLLEKRNERLHLIQVEMTKNLHTFKGRLQGPSADLPRVTNKTGYSLLTSLQLRNSQKLREYFNRARRQRRVTHAQAPFSPP